jgi:hypothetical protein
VSQRLLVAPLARLLLLSEKRALPSSPIEVAEEEGEVPPAPEEEEENAPKAAAPRRCRRMGGRAPAAAKRMRLFAYYSGQQQKNWAGAVPAKKARRAPKKTIKKMRVALPVGDGDSATLAHGALV